MMRASLLRVHQSVYVIAMLLVTLHVALSTSSFAEEPDIVFNGTKANKVLFLGNSITLHGPKPDIGWEGNWGMAASAKEKDYVHLVLKAIAQQTGKTPESMVVNIAAFERQFESYDVDSALRQELAFKPDLVIVAIGENVPELSTEQLQAAFRLSMAKLLTSFKQSSNPDIVVRGCFWGNRIKDQILEETCKQVGGRFASADTLGNDEANYARSERDFTHQGVAAHPGDRGMQAIADVIVKAIANNAK
ncbi:SGNH/GDSL hydrolase family protein [Novipirellula sp. SH528]|uniref:SGNH/GDSL hydrolase family protein n=1 Tax=Novipirellula sp. SH528 TaxID=3454466 RepID=UPI003F9F1AFB